MPRFRTTNVKPTETVNRAGGVAYKESPELELVSLLLTSFVKDQFYRGADEQVARVGKLVSQLKDKMFAAKAAIYARNKFGMRSITHVLAGELAHQVKGEQWTRMAIRSIVRRPDDILEILAYYGNTYGRPIPNSLKKGLRDALAKFDEYQLAKYRGGKSDVKLVDIFNLFHPKPSKEREKLYESVVQGKLKSTQTWESKHTKAGQDVQEIEDEGEKKEKLAKLKSENWKELISTHKLGYFALLRNLRNILEQADKDTQTQAFSMLQDVGLIKKSLVLPFRFQTALKQIEQLPNSREAVVAIQNALDLSVDNVPKLSGKTLVAVDNSGSMGGQPQEIATLFGAMLYKSNDADLMVFASEAWFTNYNPKDSTISLARRLQNEPSGGTNFNAIFDTAKKAYDRIIILSDEQGWEADRYGWGEGGAPKESYKEYKKRTGADPKLYTIDLTGYGDLQFPEQNVYALAGFSEKIFDLMEILEQDRQALINEIEKVTIE